MAQVDGRWCAGVPAQGGAKVKTPTPCLSKAGVLNKRLQFIASAAAFACVHGEWIALAAWLLAVQALEVLG